MYPMHPSQQQRDKRNTAIAVIFLAFGMLALAFASIPLYRLFCESYGFGGTIKATGAVAPTRLVNRQIKVRFNTDLSPRLPWRFTPLQKEMVVSVGEISLAFFQVTNLSDKPMIGWATYNVTPHKVGSYFSKMECFCFTEQYIPPSQTVDFPVSFFIDPAIIDDRNVDDVQVMTLSYTFFPMKKGS